MKRRVSPCAAVFSHTTGVDARGRECVDVTMVIRDDVNRAGVHGGGPFNTVRFHLTPDAAADLRRTLGRALREFRRRGDAEETRENE